MKFTRKGRRRRRVNGGGDRGKERRRFRRKREKWRGRLKNVGERRRIGRILG